MVYCIDGFLIINAYGISRVGSTNTQTRKIKRERNTFLKFDISEKSK